MATASRPFFSSLAAWMLYTPTSVTRVPGDAVPTSARSHVSARLRGSSPVGTSSGRSCSFSDCWSAKELLPGSTTHGSRLHLAPPAAAAPCEQTRGSARPPPPGLAVKVVSRRQSRHMAVTLVATCFGLLAAVTMPGTMTSCATLLLCTPRALQL